jgi:hypothetical protein
VFYKFEGFRVTVNVGSEAQNYGIIVGLHVTLKGPFPLVGESELARESEMACFGLFCLLKNNIRN